MTVVLIWVFATLAAFVLVLLIFAWLFKPDNGQHTHRHSWQPLTDDTRQCSHCSVMQQKVVCRVCKGYPVKKEEVEWACKFCDGSGVVGHGKWGEACQQCDGEGSGTYIAEIVCERCNGNEYEWVQMNPAPSDNTENQVT